MWQSDIGWIAGILDGEGSVVLVKNSYVRKSDGRNSISSRVLVAVTDFEILKKYTGLLSDFKINYGYVRQDKHPIDKYGWRRQHAMVQVHVHQQESVIKLLSAVIPSLTLKKPAAELVLEFTKWKKANTLNLFHHGIHIDKSLQDTEQDYWKRYREVFVEKARSTHRNLMDAVTEPSTPIHWPD